MTRKENLLRFSVRMLKLMKKRTKGVRGRLNTGRMVRGRCVARGDSRGHRNARKMKEREREKCAKKEKGN